MELLQFKIARVIARPLPHCSEYVGGALFVWIMLLRWLLTTLPRLSTRASGRVDTFCYLQIPELPI